MKSKNEGGGGSNKLQENKNYFTSEKKVKAERSTYAKQKKWTTSCDDTFPWTQGYWIR